MGKSPKKSKKKDKADIMKQAQEKEEDEAEFLKVALELRVKELENLNLGLTQKCDYLESQNDVFKVQLEDTKQEKEDLVTHLQRSWTEEKTNVKELEDRLYGVSQARIEDGKEFEKRLLEKDHLFEEMKMKLEKNILELGAKLTALEDFRVQKENLTAETQELVNTLQEERQTFKDKYDDLDTKLIIYREKLKLDSVDILTCMAENVQKAGKLCLTATVKSAIKSNIRLQNELEDMAKENIKLRKKIDSLTNTLREKRMTIEVVEEENDQIHKKCNQYKEVVQDLIQRQLWMEMQIRPMDALEEELTALKIEHAKCLVKENLILDQSAGQEMVEYDHVEIVSPLDMSLKTEVNFLRDIIVKVALTAKDLSEAENDEEMAYLKGRFKTMIVKLHQIASDISNMPPDTKCSLTIPAPSVMKYLSYQNNES